MIVIFLNNNKHHIIIIQFDFKIKKLYTDLLTIWELVRRWQIVYLLQFTLWGFMKQHFSPQLSQITK